MGELEDRLRTAYEGFGRRDIDAVLAMMDPGIEWDATDALVHTGMYHGHDGVKDYLVSLDGFWDEYVLDVEQITQSGEGDHVLVLGSVKGRLAETGQDVEARFAHVLQMDDGLVARLKVCLDRDAALQEMPESQAS